MTINILTNLPKSGSPLVYPTERNIPSEYLVPYMHALDATDIDVTLEYLDLTASLNERSRHSVDRTET